MEFPRKKAEGRRKVGWINLSLPLESPLLLKSLSLGQRKVVRRQGERNTLPSEHTYFELGSSLPLHACTRAQILFFKPQGRICFA